MGKKGTVRELSVGLDVVDVELATEQAELRLKEEGSSRLDIAVDVES